MGINANGYIVAMFSITVAGKEKVSYSKVVAKKPIIHVHVYTCVLAC